MFNILLTGIGGQGTVLAAKILAYAAQGKGWQVRTAETIGMAQRGGSVVSHVRIGDAADDVFEPLLTYKSADLIISFEPAEGLRVLPYLAADGLLVTATTKIAPVTATLSGGAYSGEEMLDFIRQANINYVIVDDENLCTKIGSTKVLNTILLACALNSGKTPLSIDDLKKAVTFCVKEQFVNVNLKAIDLAVEYQFLE